MTRLFPYRLPCHMVRIAPAKHPRSAGGDLLGYGLFQDKRAVGGASDPSKCGRGGVGPGLVEKRPPGNA